MIIQMRRTLNNLHASGLPVLVTSCWFVYSDHSVVVDCVHIGVVFWVNGNNRDRSDGMLKIVWVLAWRSAIPEVGRRHCLLLGIGR